MSKHFIASFSPKFKKDRLTFDLKLDALFYDTKQNINNAAIKRTIQKHFKPFLTKVYSTYESGFSVLPNKCFKLSVAYQIDPVAKKAEFKYFIISTDNCTIEETG